MNSKPGRDRLLSFCLGYFRRHERTKPSVWVPNNITLPPGHESTPGPVSFADRPYLKEPLDCVVEPGVEDVIFIAPTRMGKTFLLRMIWAYVVAILRLPMLWYDSTMDKARSISKKELRPLVEANRVLSERKPIDADHYTNTLMMFPGSNFEMFGANSDAQASSETAAVVLGNELGKWRDASEEEASILEQTRHRTESYEDERRHFYSTTPTIEDSVEWQEYLKGDQRKFFVPCPCCGEMQQLEWGGVDVHYGVKWSPDARRPDGKWDWRAVVETARYHCINTGCEGEPWAQEQLYAAIRGPGAEWRPTAEPEAPGRRSYHVNGLYGPLKVNTMGSLALKFLSARKTGFIKDRRDFWNADMGMVWIDDVRVIEAKSFAALELPYLRGELPPGFQADVVIFGADVQTWGIPWVGVAFNWAGKGFVFDHGLCSGWKDLEKVQRDYSEFGASRVIIDINFEDRRPETLQAIHERLNLGWVGADAFEFAADFVKVEHANPYIGGKLEKLKAKVPKLVLSAYDFKLELEKRYAGEIRRLFFYQLPPLIATAEEVEDQRELYHQLKDERRVPRKKARKGLPRYEFRPRTNRNHFGDCMVYVHALFWYLSKSKSHKARNQRGSVQVETEA